MSMKKMLLMTGSVLTMFLAASVTAQQPPPAQQANPSPGCTAPPTQLEGKKKGAMEFFRPTGEARVALADPTYKQHNPAFKKRAEDNKVSDYEEFKNAFLAQAARGQGPGAGRGAASGPQPPQGNPFDVVTAECEIVTVTHKGDRTAPPPEPRQ